MSSVNSILLSDVQLQIQFYRFSFFLFVLIYHYVVNMKLCPIFMSTKLNMKLKIFSLSVRKKWHVLQFR